MSSNNLLSSFSKILGFQNFSCSSIQSLTEKFAFLLIRISTGFKYFVPSATSFISSALIPVEFKQSFIAKTGRP